jgi:hypothetical protein
LIVLSMLQEERRSPWVGRQERRFTAPVWPIKDTLSCSGISFGFCSRHSFIHVGKANVKGCLVSSGVGISSAVWGTSRVYCELLMSRKYVWQNLFPFPLADISATGLLWHIKLLPLPWRLHSSLNWQKNSWVKLEKYVGCHCE